MGGGGRGDGDREREKMKRARVGGQRGGRCDGRLLGRREDRGIHLLVSRICHPRLLYGARDRGDTERERERDRKKERRQRGREKMKRGREGE